MAPTWNPSWRFLLTCWFRLEYVFLQKAGIGGVVVPGAGRGGFVVDGVFDDKITVAKESGGGAFRADRAMVGCGGERCTGRSFVLECKPKVVARG